MEARDKVLELLTLNGKINGMKSKIQSYNDQIVAKNVEISKAEEKKVKVISDKEWAEGALGDANETVETINERVKALRRELAAAKKTQADAEKNLASFTDEVMAEPDKNLNTLSAERTRLEVEKKELNESIAREQEAYNALSQELRESGIEMNFTPQAPTTTVTYL